MWHGVRLQLRRRRLLSRRWKRLSLQCQQEDQYHHSVGDNYQLFEGNEGIGHNSTTTSTAPSL